MSRFLQLHLLTFYPPANLNRDDLGRPKTAEVGGVPRLRVSSQALKRAFRTSDAFRRALDGHMGSRTQRLGTMIRDHLLARGVAEERALEVTRAIIPVFGKEKPATDKNPTYTEQLAFIAPAERDAAIALAERMAAGEVNVETPDPSALLVKADTAADIALFGRMLADNPDFNREAAAQVAHAITTHRVTVEDDYYTAVDDLKKPSEDAGAGFVGEAAFGSGVFYLYACIDRALLWRNLGGAATLATTALVALAEAAATVSPRGKQNSYAAHGRAHYVLAEAGDSQPRTLAGAFAKPVTGDDLMAESVAQLKNFRERIDTAYGADFARAEMDVLAGAGSLADVLAFIRGLGQPHA
jgi:CRISPR system Cascade subunit CasC